MAGASFGRAKRSAFPAFGEIEGRGAACPAAGVAGGAILTAADRSGGAMLCNCAAFKGRPPLLCSAACLLSKVAPGGGGLTRATTVRDWIGADGLTFSIRPEPSTACLVGTTAGPRAFTRDCSTLRWSNRTKLRATGSAEVNARDVVAATAPGTLRLT